ncbi:MAG TPA: CDP-alcohol phosphatidyltransferase family protein [Candidatus Sulfomarinibacteraceae bacterium]|nr:CDP-alcohol phosphatidyltransferase family protein [Candidatus Sulfomarinibacteraceae bacterium]
MLRERTFFIVDPIVTFLARYQISPNTLTVLGTLGHFLVAWLIVLGQMRPAGLALMLIAPLDGLDGALARKLGRKAGGFGAFLDSTLDRLAEIVVFGGFLIYASNSSDPRMLATTYIAITGSLMVSYARARAEALSLSCRIGILSRVERYFVLTITLLLGYPMVGLAIIAIFAYITVAQRIFHVWQQSVRE